MPPENTNLETLKNILENSLHPEQFDSHPWAKSLSVLDMVTNTPDLLDKTPGQQLVFMIEKLFVEMMPSVAPRHGKRLDTRWGEFGILAAQYFAPLKFGAPSPVSLRDAWGRIDQSILLFVYGKFDDTLSNEEREIYKLVGGELEVAPNSTLSDWHRKGLQRLMEMILARESYLAKSMSKPAVIPQDGQPVVRADDPPLLSETSNQKSGKRRFIFPLLIFIVLGLVLIGGLKAWKIYNMALLVWQDVAGVQEVIRTPASNLERVKDIGPHLTSLRQDFQLLKTEAEPFLWLGPWLGWVPVYGGDLSSIQDLMTVADSLLAFADTSYQAALPLVDAVDGENGSHLNPPLLAILLKDAAPQFTEAQKKLGLALEARSHLELDNLSPRVRDLILNDVDPLLPLLQEGTTLATEFPRLMGASDEGPKTYLVLVQNEDELRPTGGFITAAGTLLVRDGRIGSITFENSGNLDDWTKPYPIAPWQLKQYMNSPVLIFRDTNWFTNYPTAALYAEYLYSYISDHSVDGVIAFDQQMLVDFLAVIGPIELDGVPYPINSGNVVAYMRASKTPTAEELASPDWNNKAFINKISRALISKIFSGDVEWEQLSTLLIKSLNEHHLMIQLDSPPMTTFLADHHWDGAVRSVDGDYLMVVDTNVGFNKTNAVVESELFYDVDLTNASSPTGSLTVIHKNNAVGITSCRHWNKVRVAGEKDYPIEDCYWNYLRIYKPDGTTLLGATPQILPANWMILNQSPPAEVDILDEEIDGVQAFGTIQVVPGGQSLTVSFQFALPVDILEKQLDPDQTIYRLTLQKQPGTLAVPITIRIHLANNASVLSMPDGAVLEDDNILIQTSLREDIEIDVQFRTP
ncbi:MAG: DUF4012 domain-containing protein [Chloroflexi bacterium]|nr:DUF4012 domain-containing protein [Chloroflexota bacterium]